MGMWVSFLYQTTFIFCIYYKATSSFRMEQNLNKISLKYQNFIFLFILFCLKKLIFVLPLYNCSVGFVKACLSTEMLSLTDFR